MQDAVVDVPEIGEMVQTAWPATPRLVPVGAIVSPESQVGGPFPLVEAWYVFESWL